MHTMETTSPNAAMDTILTGNGTKFKYQRPHCWYLEIRFKVSKYKFFTIKCRQTITIFYVNETVIFSKKYTEAM